MNDIKHLVNYYCPACGVAYGYPFILNKPEKMFCKECEVTFEIKITLLIDLKFNMDKDWQKPNTEGDAR